MLVSACFSSRHLKSEILRGRVLEKVLKTRSCRHAHYRPRRTPHGNPLHRCSCPGRRSRDRHSWGRRTGPEARRTPAPSSRCSTCTHPCCTARSHCTARDKPLQRRQNESMQEGKQMREWGKDRRRGCLRGISENQLHWEKFRYEMLDKIREKWSIELIQTNPLNCMKTPQTMCQGLWIPKSE